MNLQGVGPKTVAVLYRELGVRTLDDLEAAASNGRVRSIKGMGPKKESLILKAIEEQKRFAGRHLLPDAHDTAATQAVPKSRCGDTAVIPEAHRVLPSRW